MEQGVGLQKAFIEFVAGWSARYCVSDGVERGPNIGGEQFGRSAGRCRDAAWLDCRFSIRVNPNKNTRAASNGISKVRKVERCIRNDPIRVLKSLREEAHGAAVMIWMDKRNEHGEASDGAEFLDNGGLNSPKISCGGQVREPVRVQEIAIKLRTITGALDVIV
jgi:hypothetical protein